MGAVARAGACVPDEASSGLTVDQAVGSAPAGARLSGTPAEGAGRARGGDLPDWLVDPPRYDPPRDRDAFVTRSALSIASVLGRFRLDDGHPSPLSPSAPAKLILGLACILLTSLSRNYFFVLVMLALVLVRACLLPSRKLARVASVAGAAAALTALVMLPAILLGQSHSALLVGTKVLVSVSIAMIVALTTPFNEITGALRAFRVPNLFILTIDMALKNIVSLGRIALEVLTSLRLRSVGRNRDKGASIGGTAGVVLLKSKEAAEVTYASMECRGFEGEYVSGGRGQWRARDAAWAAALAALVVLFVYLQSLV
jgi:cobalt/nickel transport system permease protein